MALRLLLAVCHSSVTRLAAGGVRSVEARTADEDLTELQPLTDDPRVLALADHVVDITFNLHKAPDRADRDRRASVARPVPCTTPSPPPAGVLVRA
ncbi:hypothetical protein [Streptomyces sp. NPDC093109]|uniref:hypothetical protein n=1 Tax=Streptomyces sp. NPDC093109 TaxID=3154977 RepID=UPI00344B8F02